MTDIVDRLRKWTHSTDPVSACDLMDAAAAVIERDRAENALEELSALDQKLELEYGLTGNPLIKAGRHTPPPQTTSGKCSKPREGT